MGRREGLNSQHNNQKFRIVKRERGVGVEGAGLKQFTEYFLSLFHSLPPPPPNPPFHSLMRPSRLSHEAIVVINLYRCVTHHMDCFLADDVLVS